MFIDELHEFIRFLVRKGQGQHYSPFELDRAIHFSSMEMFRHYLPETEKAQINTSILGNFYKTKTIDLADGQGEVPDDYAYFLDAYLSDDKWVEEIKEGDWTKRVTDEVEPPDQDYPIITLRHGNVLVRPTSLISVKMLYVRYPLRPKYGYTVSNLDYIFDEDNSIDVEWPEIVHNELVQKTVTNLGFNLKNDQTAIQYEAFKKQINNVK